MAVHVVSILDRSSSMGGTEKEVIGAYNAFIEEQRKIAQKTNTKIKATLILFDDQYETVYMKTSVESVPVMDHKTYYVRGMTALYDAIGKTVRAFEGKDKVIFFIETDGQENASKEFNHTALKTLVEQKTKDGWDFNFVGADLSQAVTASMSFAIGINKAMAFDKSSSGYSARNATFSAATMAYVTQPTSTSNIKETT